MGLFVPPLRPPGAGDEEAFLRKCVRCGKCATVCPYGSIELAGGFGLDQHLPRVRDDRQVGQHPALVACVVGIGRSGFQQVADAPGDGHAGADPAAVATARDNAANNATSLCSGLPDMVEPAQARYGIVLANILASPLKVLAPLLCAHLAPGGYLVLAGILERQTQELQEAYAPDIELSVADVQDGWVLLTGRRAV